MGIKYYHPSSIINNYILKELLYLKETGSDSPRGGNGKVVKSGTRAKAKFDAMNHIFQCVADVICFFEFLHQYPNLQALYQKDLRDLFGFNPEPYTRRHHFRNPGGPFLRLIRSILYQDRHLVEGERQENPDLLHIWLMAVLIENGINALTRVLEIDDQKIMHLYYDAVLIKTRSLVKDVDQRLNDEWKRRKTKMDEREIKIKAKKIAEDSHLEEDNEWALRRAEQEYYQEDRKNEVDRALGFHSISIGS